MSISVGQSGAYKTMLNASVGVSGAWKQVVGMWIGVSGEWKFVWAPVTGGAVGASDFALSPADAYAYIEWDNDGTFDRSNGADQFNWLVGGSAADYDIYLTATGDGLHSSSSTRDTWHNMAINQSLALSNTGLGVKSASGTYQIRHSASSTVVATGNWTLTAEVESP